MIATKFMGRRHRRRAIPIAAMLLSATMLAGCATSRAPQFSYDDNVPDLPVVRASVSSNTPRPLHTPPAWTVARGGTAANTPEGRVGNANAAARVEPRREGYYNAIQVYPWSEGALYQVYAAVGQITTIACCSRSPKPRLRREREPDCGTWSH